MEWNICVCYPSVWKEQYFCLHAVECSVRETKWPTKVRLKTAMSSSCIEEHVTQTDIPKKYPEKSAALWEKKILKGNCFVDVCIPIAN